MHRRSNPTAGSETVLRKDPGSCNLNKEQGRPGHVLVTGKHRHKGQDTERPESQQEWRLPALTLPKASGLAPGGRGKPQKGCKEGIHEISLIPVDPELGAPTLGPQEISLSVLAMHYYRITFF